MWASSNSSRAAWPFRPLLTRAAASNRAISATCRGAHPPPPCKCSAGCPEAIPVLRLRIQRAFVPDVLSCADAPRSTSTEPCPRVPGVRAGTAPTPSTLTTMPTGTQTVTSSRGDSTNGWASPSLSPRRSTVTHTRARVGAATAPSTRYPRGSSRAVTVIPTPGRSSTVRTTHMDGVLRPPRAPPWLADNITTTRLTNALARIYHRSIAAFLCD